MEGYGQMKSLMPRSKKENTVLRAILIFSIGLVLILCPSPSMGGYKTIIVDGGTGYQPDITLKTADPVSAGGGEFRHAWPLLSLGGPIPVEFILTYVPDMEHRMPVNLGRQQFPPWGRTKAFQSNTIFRMVETEDRTTSPYKEYVNVMLYDCTYVFVEDGAGGFVPTGPTKFQIKKSGDYYYLMNPDDERIYIFHKSGAGGKWDEQYFMWMGEVVHIMDRNNNKVTFTYNTDNLPTHITDDLGRSLNFTYISSNNKDERHISEVTDGYGRSVSFTYAACNSGSNTKLDSFTDPSGEVTDFTYYGTGENSCYLLNGINRPLGNSHIDQTWDTNPKNEHAINTQQDAYGNEEKLDYSQDEDSNIVTTVTHPDKTQRTFYHINERYPKKVVDEAGKSYTIVYNTDFRPTTVTDRLGNTTTLTYHSGSGKIASFTNAEGDTVSFSYAAQTQTFTNPANSEAFTFTFYNLIRIDYPDSTNEQFTYDANGNNLTLIDRAGKIWSYSYNSKGQMLTATNPAGGVITYTYNADATLATNTESGSGVTTFSYDAYKRLIKITYPDNTTFQLTYDLNDRITSIIDENNQTYSYTYDANGNLTMATDPASNTTKYDYDLMDRVSSVTDKLDKTTTFTYDTRGRLGTSTNPASETFTYGYSLQGWFSSVTDPGGKTTSRTYDDEGVIATLTDALSNTWNYTTDKLGRVSMITSPLSNTRSFTCDSMGRLTSSTNPLSKTTDYDYDSRGLLTSITLPGAISATYNRNDLGLITRITDPNGYPWDKGYDSMGRLTSLTDPLSNITTYAYNSRNRLSTVTFPESSLQLSYDGWGNVVRKLYSDNTDLQYTYDDNGRLLTADGLTLSYDARGDILGCNGLTVNRDDVGRIATMTVAKGKTLTYSYDSRGLLGSVSDWLGGITTFTYDAAGKLLSITRPNGIITTYTYDNDGRVVRLQEGSLSNISFIRDSNGQITSATRSLTLEPTFIDTTTTLSYDKASQVSAYTYDAMGRLTNDGTRTYTWDLASRLTGYTEGSSSVNFTYDGLGSRLTRAEGNTTSRYVWNYAFKLPSISVEKQGASDLRYYVHTPEGNLIYSIEASGNARRDYHYDEMGNTLFLSDSSGTVIAAYAYSPYGTLLASTGTEVNPFTWQGQLGVVMEGPSGLYYMRARYYDSNTLRFISRDPISMIDPRNVNPYQYAMLNPLRFVDPSGKQSIPELIANLEEATDAETAARFNELCYYSCVLAAEQEVSKAAKDADSAFSAMVDAIRNEYNTEMDYYMTASEGPTKIVTLGTDYSRRFRPQIRSSNDGSMWSSRWKAFLSRKALALKKWRDAEQADIDATVASFWADKRVLQVNADLARLIAEHRAAKKKVKLMGLQRHRAEAALIDAVNRFESVIPELSTEFAIPY
jgi:RHS repeat-associated protein